MFRSLFIAFFTASGAAQITTSMWAPSRRGTEKIGFFGSIIGANETHTTLAVNYDNATDPDPLNPSYSGVLESKTWTVGPTLWEQTVSVGMGAMPTEVATRYDDELERIRCEKQTETGAAPTCTISYGRALAAEMGCKTAERPGTTVVYTYTNSYPARLTYSAGVETVHQTIEYLSLPTGKPYSWCSDGDFQGYPSDFSGSVETLSTLSAAYAATYQVIITAGQEKLPSKTGSGEQPSSTGAAVPLRTAAPAYIGLGAALAAFVL